MKRLNVAIVEDGNGKIHFFKKIIDESTREFEEFQEQMQVYGHELGGALIMMYRQCDVAEIVRL